MAKGLDVYVALIVRCDPHNAGPKSVQLLPCCKPTNQVLQEWRQHPPPEPGAHLIVFPLGATLHLTPRLDDIEGSGVLLVFGENDVIRRVAQNPAAFGHCPLLQYDDVEKYFAALRRPEWIEKVVYFTEQGTDGISIYVNFVPTREEYALYQIVGSSDDQALNLGCNYVRPQTSWQAWEPSGEAATRKLGPNTDIVNARFLFNVEKYFMLVRWQPEPPPREGLQPSFCSIMSSEEFQREYGVTEDQMGQHKLAIRKDGHLYWLVKGLFSITPMIWHAATHTYVQRELRRQPELIWSVKVLPYDGLILLRDLKSLSMLQFSLLHQGEQLGYFLDRKNLKGEVSILYAVFSMARTLQGLESMGVEHIIPFVHEQWVVPISWVAGDFVEQPIYEIYWESLQTGCSTKPSPDTSIDEGSIEAMCSHVESAVLKHCHVCDMGWAKSQLDQFRELLSLIPPQVACMVDVVGMPDYPMIQCSAFARYLEHCKLLTFTYSHERNEPSGPGVYTTTAPATLGCLNFILIRAFLLRSSMPSDLKAMFLDTTDTINMPGMHLSMVPREDMEKQVVGEGRQQAAAAALCDLEKHCNRVGLTIGQVELDLLALTPPGAAPRLRIVCLPNMACITKPTISPFLPVVSMQEAKRRMKQNTRILPPCHN